MVSAYLLSIKRQPKETASWKSYFVYVVLSQLGHGGSVSVRSSSLTF
nr:MAG TPA: hypothetical protein [Caudoviricetes sp.]DAZ32005.1 MAG TPA: hypothetical protein [Caudoviricetes sp.]